MPPIKPKSVPDRDETLRAVFDGPATETLLAQLPEQFRAALAQGAKHDPLLGVAEVVVKIRLDASEALACHFSGVVRKEAFSMTAPPKPQDKIAAIRLAAEGRLPESSATRAKILAKLDLLANQAALPGAQDAFHMVAQAVAKAVVRTVKLDLDAKALKDCAARKTA